MPKLVPHFIGSQLGLYSTCLHPADAIAVPLRLLDELRAFEPLTAFVTLHLTPNGSEATVRITLRRVPIWLEVSEKKVEAARGRFLVAASGRVPKAN